MPFPLACIAGAVPFTGEVILVEAEGGGGGGALVLFDFDL